MASITHEKPSYEDFEKSRKDAIKMLQELHWDNDPHFIIAVGTHDEFKSINLTCKEWCRLVCASIVTEL